MVDAPLRVVDDHRRHVGQQLLGGGKPFAQGLRFPSTEPRAHRRRQDLDTSATRGGSRTARMDSQATVPVRLHSHVARQPNHAVIGALAGGDGCPAGKRLGQREGEVVGLAAADEKADGPDP